MDGTVATAVIAAGSALAGSGLTQAATLWARRGDRRSTRSAALADLRRANVDSCTTAAVDLRKLLQGSSPDASALTNAMSLFDVAVARVVDPAAVTALRMWREGAVNRANGLLGAESENMLWANSAAWLGWLWQQTTDQ